MTAVVIDASVAIKRVGEEPGTNAALALDYPACECVDLALAREQRCRFVTADERLLRKIETSPVPGLRRHARPPLPKLG